MVVDLSCGVSFERISSNTIVISLFRCGNEDDYLLQLSELVNMEGYSEWIRLVAEFTSKSLQSWQVNDTIALHFLNIIYFFPFQVKM